MDVCALCVCVPGASGSQRDDQTLYSGGLRWLRDAVWMPGPEPCSSVERVLLTNEPSAQPLIVLSFVVIKKVNIYILP